MENNFNTMESKQKIFDQFLSISDDYRYLTNVYWIYKVTNTINNKIYVGKTKDIRTRARNYINAYQKGDNCNNMITEMQRYGIENFKMTDLEIAKNSTSASIKEKYYIDLFDSIDCGYNVSLNSPDYSTRAGAHISRPQTVYAKISKSKLICGINPESKKIVFSTGLKLFGELINKKKDEIKSCAKRQTTINGYFIYYLNDIDFTKQIESAKLKIEKNSIYSDKNLLYPIFIHYSEYLKKILINIDDNPEYFGISFITQSSDSNYKYDSILKFYEYYKTLDNTIVDKQQMTGTKLR